MARKGNIFLSGSSTGRAHNFDSRIQDGADETTGAVIFMRIAFLHDGAEAHWST